MGSFETTPVVGEFTLPLINADTKNSDPWQRPYFIPPNLGNLVTRSFPLIDIRPIISDPKYDPQDLLKTHGFGVVKNASSFLTGRNKDDLTEESIAAEYYPEIKELVMKTTGAKKVVVIRSGLRKGSAAPQEFKLPTEIAPANLNPKSNSDEKKDQKPVDKNSAVAAAVRGPGIFAGKPLRSPHMDYTPLGARQEIRSDREDIQLASIECGAIAAEDKICEGQAFRANNSESDHLIAEQYNQNGKLGPRYAAYSIWRPLVKVGRDPIALAQRADVKAFNDKFLHWPYENRIPGTKGPSGDFLRQFAMLGLRGESSASDGITGALNFYYVSAQEPDEVMFIKLFDSAALGKDAQHAGAPYHGSPEIGSVDGDNARESLELRVFAFW